MIFFNIILLFIIFIYNIVYIWDSIGIQDVVESKESKKKNLFTYSFLFCNKKALLVQFGRTWVSKTQCRRFKSYRAWFHSCFVKSKILGKSLNINLNLTSCGLKKGGGQKKKRVLINQRSNWSPRLYCK